MNFDFLVPLLTAAASTVGILVALDQITAVARLRRQILFWSGLRTSKPRRSDAATIESLERAATAKIVSYQAVPAWRLLFPTFAFLIALITAWQAGYAAGRIPAPNFSWDKFQEAVFEQGSEPMFLVLVPFLAYAGICGWLNVFAERSRLHKAYLGGKDLKLEEFSVAGGNWPATAILGGLGYLQVFAFSIGVSGWAVLFGAAQGMHDVNAPLPWPAWMGIVLLGGAFTVMAGLLAFLKMYVAIRNVWIHPRPLHHRVGKSPREPQKSFTGSSRRKQP
ncbi:hypothetical protein [Paenarthrobacter sp. YJN-5]|uniref:hypothetical protein n=1 Tax=Paenarthrobacter sp. YJN-5 TaxID=2735316 RepID=UPI0018785BD1|nr:hypothetical protein [Paenarthrobacter sp. YJN-5]QOT19795.1 hypothetical protein HMI59_24375 [Paenarthrobacter sp. YJN-5]